MTKIAFFETELWEEEYFRQNLAELTWHFSSEPIGPTNIDLAAEAQVISVFIRSEVGLHQLAQLPSLRLITTRSTGFDHIDLAACRERGIVVSNVPFYAENTVAEHTFGLILALSRQIHKAYLRTARGDFSLKGLEGFDLKGRTMGVVGAGSIGLHVVRIARGFGMEVLAYDPRENHLISEVLGFTYVPLEELLRRSDIISLHAPYIPKTHHMINKDNIRLIKSGALLINTARGALVDTEALLWALDQGILAGVGLDVLEGEELIHEEKQLLEGSAGEEKLRALLRQHLLLRREDVVVTPHIAFYSREAQRRIVETTAANIRAFLEGKPQNTVAAL